LREKASERNGTTITITRDTKHETNHFPICTLHTPFDANNPSYRSVSGKFKIFGIGEDINESIPTEKPELVLIHPNVSIMTGSSMELMNPNGWYCLISKVNVMASSTINLHCKAHLASSKEGTTVLGGGDDQGVTVMGKATINRQGCE
jgi:hypothetical protein